MAGGSRTTNDRLIPHVMFTDPPLARVGLSEREAERQDIRCPHGKVTDAQSPPDDGDR